MRTDLADDTKPSPKYFFFSSAPDFRPDWCDSIGRWRCADVEAATQWAKTIEPTAYVVSDGESPGGVKRLSFGRRDSGECGALLSALSEMGYRTQADRFGGRACSGVTIWDPTNKKDA